MSFSSKICTISTSGAALAGAAIFLQGCSHNYHCKQYKDKASCAKDDECAWAAVCWEKKWVHCDAKQQDECDAISICAWDGKTCKIATSDDDGDQGHNGASDDVLIVHPIPPPHEVPAACEDGYHLVDGMGCVKDNQGHHNATSPDVVTTDGFIAEEAAAATGGLRVFKNDESDAASYPESLAGVFQMPLWSACQQTPGVWGSCPAYSKAPGVVCFGGSSQVTFDGNQICQDFDSGKPGNLASETSEDGKIWYDIGGANSPASETVWWTQSHVDNLNSAMTNNKFPTDKYIGIFYDLELIHEPNIDFNASFQLAKAAGLKVMVSTSYTFPYDDASQAAGYPQSLVPTFTKILQDPNVDILAPQFYQNGLVPTGGAQGPCAGDKSGMCGFDAWKINVPASTQVQPIFRTTQGISWSDINADFKKQVAAAEEKCQSDESFCVFTKSGKYWLWSAN